MVEARKDTLVLIHPLTDDRRILPVEKRGTILQAPDEFMLVVSYNPGYQSVLKDLKQSTRGSRPCAHGSTDNPLRCVLS